MLKAGGRMVIIGGVDSRSFYCAADLAPALAAHGVTLVDAPREAVPDRVPFAMTMRLPDTPPLITGIWEKPKGKGEKKRQRSAWRQQQKGHGAR